MEALSRRLLLSIENNRKGIAMVTHLIEKKIVRRLSITTLLQAAVGFAPARNVSTNIE